MAGFIGRGGGSIVVPALHIMGLEMKNAVATSALVVTMSATAGFISHMAIAASPNWAIWGPSIGAVFAGSQIGSRIMVGKMKSSTVRVMFGIALLCIATVLIVRSVVLG